MNIKIRRKPLILDSLAILILLLISFIFSQKVVNFSNHPVEDAAILMRYAENLADGYGIVWNIGEKPVDGGTDFLFLVAVATLNKSGLPLETSVRFLDFLSHFLTLFLIYLAPRKLFDAPAFVGFVSSSIYAIGPGLYYTAAYFGTPFFALFACLSFIAAVRIMQGKTGQLQSAAFAILCLTTGLIRPEGVILSSFMMLSILLYSGIKSYRVPLLWFCLIFLLLGGAYFLWRWNYFGYLLPNPFYIKGGGHLYPVSLKQSLKFVALFGLPLWPFYLLGFRNQKLRKLVISFLLPVFGFAASFIFLSNEMNFAARFQYAVYSILLISWYPFVKGLRGEPWFLALKTKPMPIRFTCAVLLVAGFFLLLTSCSFIYKQMQGRQRNEIAFMDGKFSMAQYLNRFKDQGYWMATTESGLLPLYSQWNTIDTWGLNDQWIAHHGEVTEEYLDRYNPEIIIFHAYFSPVNSNCPDPYPRWTSMTQILNVYAEKNPYTLASVFGTNSCDTYYYYVKNDFPDSNEIIESIRHFDYRLGGYPAKNFLTQNNP